MEPKVTVYSLDYCPYCVRAKELLSRYNIPFREVIVAADDKGTRLELEEKSGMKTFPQIFYGNDVIGGYTDLKALDDSVGLPNRLK